jgi:hypothetical protein
MIAGTALVTAVLVLAMQVMDPAASGTRPTITLASQFGIPADRTFSDWPGIENLIDAVLNDNPVWFLLVLAAAVLYWLTDWTNEKLGVLFGRPRPRKPEPPGHPQLAQN